MEKQVLAIHDLACYGKCSLTIVQPILSAAGCSTSVLPTALLSTHTGGFGKPFISDLSNDMEQIIKHWKTIDVTFDAIYSGYVSTLSQIEQIESCFQNYPNAYHMVDPVMGDHGKLYASLPENLPEKMRELCAKANLITPNMTEAYALIKEPYQVGPYDDIEITRVCKRLANLCKGDIILTSVLLEKEQFGSVVYHHEDASITYIMREVVDIQYHGTGDVFASSVLCALLHMHSLDEAVMLATDYVLDTLSLALMNNKDERHGLPFEQTLWKFIDKIRETNEG